MHFALDGRRVFAGTGGRDHEPGMPGIALVHGAGMDHSVFALQARALALLGLVPEMRVHPDLLAAARAGSHTTLELMTSWSLSARAQLGANPAPGMWLSGGALRLLERAEPESLAADLAACDAYRDAGAAAAQIRCPTLLLLGGEDRMTPAARAQAFAGRFADARIALLPEAGHMMMAEDPVATLAAMRTIL